MFDSSPLVKRISMDSLPNSELLNLGSPSKKSMESIFSNISGASSSCSVKKFDKENFILPRAPSAKKNKKSYTNLKVEDSIGKMGLSLRHNLLVLCVLSSAFSYIKSSSTAMYNLRLKLYLEDV